MNIEKLIKEYHSIKSALKANPRMDEDGEMCARMGDKVTIRDYDDEEGTNYAYSL